MKKIVIIGASELQNPLILRAKEMGLQTHVFAWKEGAVGENTADYFYPISIVEKDKILKKCREIKPDAVLTIASELANITVNYIARNLGLTTNSEKSIILSTNKYEMRCAFNAIGIDTPVFYRIGEDDNLDNIYNMKLPVLVKPTDRSGSRGITKVDSFDEIKSAISRAIDISFEKKAIVEEYIEGDEYSFEAISYNGEHHLLAITQKYTTGEPYFIEKGHIQPANLSEKTIGCVKKIVFRALDALEIKFGASHTEFKIDKFGNIKIIEIGSRMGGDCIGSDLVKLSTGYDYLGMTIQVALGQTPVFKKVYETKVTGIKYIFSQQDYLTFENIKREYSKNIYRYSNIEIKNNEITDSSSRCGFYIITADTVDEVLRLCELT